jgi:hypothetical protein
MEWPLLLGSPCSRVHQVWAHSNCTILVVVVVVVVPSGPPPPQTHVGGGRHAIHGGGVEAT